MVALARADAMRVYSHPQYLDCASLTEELTAAE
jgi:hypothetical protein